MSYGGGGIPFPGGGPPRDRYVNPYAAYGAPPAPYGDQRGMMPSSMPTATQDPYAAPKPGTIAYAKLQGPDGIEEYTPVIAQETAYGIQWVTATARELAAAGIPPPATQFPQSARMPTSALPHSGVPPGMHSSPNPSTRYLGTPDDLEDGYPPRQAGMSDREYEKVIKRWEKEKDKQRRAEEKAHRRAEKEERRREREWGQNSQDPYDITGGRGERPRRMSTGAGLGFERTRRISGGAMLRDDELSRRLESLDTSFNTRRERRMSGAGPNAAGFRSRRGSIGDAMHDLKIGDDYDDPLRPSFYPPHGAGVPGGGGYGAPVPGGYGAGARSMPGSPVRSHSAFPPSTHTQDYGRDEVPRGGPSPRPGYYSRSRHASPARGPAQLPGGYGGPSSNYGGDPAYRSYGAERPHY